MGTPHKNNQQHFESPYARHLPQYPSQNGGFVPNEVFSGKSRLQSSTPYKQNSNNYNNQHGNNSNNYHSNYNNHNNRRRGGNGGNNRYFNANRGVGSGGSNSGSNAGGAGGYYQNNYQSNYNQHQQRYSNSGNRQQPYYGQKFNKSDSNSRDDYYHPSMLVDPWKDLLERHNALKNSQIEVPSSEKLAERVLRDDVSSSASSSPPPSPQEEEDEASTTTPTPAETEATASPSLPTA